MTRIKCACCGDIYPVVLLVEEEQHWVCGCGATKIAFSKEGIRLSPKSLKFTKIKEKGSTEFTSVLDYFPTSEDAQALKKNQDPGEISDGCYTFNELYEYRHILFGLVVKGMKGWKSMHHSDGTFYPGWFIAGITTKDGPVSLRVPVRLWDEFPGEERERAPEWDGYTSDNVMERLKNMW